MDTLPPPPPLPASVKRALRGFSADQVQEARKTLASLAQNCTDYRTRKEAAEYIDKTARADEDQFFKGDEQALEQLASVFVEQLSGLGVALHLFAKQAISRADLDMIMKTVAADQSTKIADLELARAFLERENKHLAHMLETGKRIDAAPLPQGPVEE